MIEIGAKLGKKNSRRKNISYARFLMILANFVVDELAISKENIKLDCWIKRIEF